VKVIVYNIPKLQAVDFIEGKAYRFIGDTSLMHPGFLLNFHIQPARTLYKLDQDEPLKDIVIEYPFISFHNKKILLVDENFSFEATEKIPVDLIIISK